MFLLLIVSHVSVIGNMNRSTVAGVVYYFSLVFGFKMIVRLSLSTKFEMCLLLTTRMTRKNQNLQIEWHFTLRELLQTFLSPHTHLHKIMHTCTRIHSRTHSWTLWVKLGEVCWIRESGCIPGYNGLTRSHTHIQTHTLSLHWKQKELYQSNLETADSLEQTTWERICSE